MIFPIGDDQVHGGHKPIVSYTLIALNLLVFGFEMTLSNPGLNAFFHDFGVVPVELFAGEDRYTLITNMFIHAGIAHLLGNMIYLWIFGDNIEAIIGNLPFLGFYLIGGIFASFIHSVLDPTSTIPAVGASGAISALMGAYLIMFPKSQIKMIFVVFFKIFYISAVLFLGFWIVQQLISGFQPKTQGGGVAWWAHIGGFAYGLIAGYFIKKYHPYEYHARKYRPLI